MVNVWARNSITRPAIGLAVLALQMLAPSTKGFGFSSGRALCTSKSCVQAQNIQQNHRHSIPVQLSAGNQAGGLPNGWHLVRTPGPQKTGDVVSIMRTANLLRSDPNFAGLAIRCRTKSELQVAFVVITPFHPRTHPKVTVTANRAPIHFEADVIPPGSMIALPHEAEVLAKGPWQSAQELTIDIEGDETRTRGVVSLEGLSAAIVQLQASCP